MKPVQSSEQELTNSFIRQAALLLSAVTFIAALAGCMSKSRANAQARMAYLAGQREAIGQMNQLQHPAATANNLPSNITFIGPFENPVVPWTTDLTLGKAILNAVYHSQIDPVMITIHRSNEEVQIDPARLLNGQDFPLRPGDVVQFNLPAQSSSRSSDDPAISPR